jgi:hypothetical protein
MYHKIIFFGVIVLVGLVLGRYLKYSTQQTYKGPSSSSVRKRVFKDDKGEYRLVPEIYVCPSNIDPDDFSHSEDSSEF